ncbi:MAG: hypothetical protein VKJ24_13200 [Synechococcales bacterium]|nr:hypothetical protein [Synechococcales bacterium]
MEFTAFDILEAAAAVLLGGITLGVVYLTTAEWRDRRRRDDEARANRNRR